MTSNQSITTGNNCNLFAFRTQNKYINIYDLFFLNFKAIPNLIIENHINCEKAVGFFNKNYSSDIKNRFYYKGNYEEEFLIKFKEDNYILDEIIVVFLHSENSIFYLFTEKNTDKTQKIIDQLSQYKIKPKKNLPEIQLLINEGNGMNTITLNINKPKLKIEDNYNDDFLEIHQTIINRLRKKNDKGLILLHGKPGTGKTSYIRYLIASVKKKVVFLPPNMAIALTNPDLLAILVENPNSIFVIEDAENIVINREQQSNSSVSTLLNLSDGLLSDCLNIQIICSFNTDLSRVDEALLRKGRLIAKYEFKALETAKAQQLSDQLGFQTKIIKPTILTDIYNQNENDFQQKKQGIGF